MLGDDDEELTSPFAPLPRAGAVFGDAPKSPGGTGISSGGSSSGLKGLAAGWTGGAPVAAPERTDW